MTYYWIDSDTGAPVTETEIREAHPLTVFPSPFVPHPERYTAVPVLEVPEHDPATHHVTLQAPALVGGVWQQAWDVVAYTTGELDAMRRARVPASVSRAQGKLALIGAGLWPAAVAFVEGITDPTQRAYAEVALHDTQEWRRDSPFLASAAAALDLSEGDLDALFITAGGLQL